MYKDPVTLLGADVIKFCSVMQVEKKLLIILPLELACLCNRLPGSWPYLSTSLECVSWKPRTLRSQVHPLGFTRSTWFLSDHKCPAKHSPAPLREGNLIFSKESVAFRVCEWNFFVH